MRMEGKILPEDSKKVFFLKFNVPECVKNVRISFDYMPKKVGEMENHINLMIYDSMKRFVGRYERFMESLTIGEEPSAGGERCLPLPGKWSIGIENHYVFCEVKYVLEIDFEKAENPYQWWKGELHTHSLHSDGSLTVKELSEYLKNKGFDFFFLTDHSTITGWRELEEVEGIKGFPGQELNTMGGHILIFGAKRFIDWKNMDSTFKTIEEIRKEVHDQSAILGVAHPYILGDPVCIGCKWELSEDPFMFDIVEVWNEDLRLLPVNLEAIHKWVKALRDGERITATAGRDVHEPVKSEWWMRTFVRARKLNLAEILYALKKGMVYLTSGPEVEVRVSGKTLGDTVTFSKDVKVVFSFSDFSKSWDAFIITKNAVIRIDASEGELSLNELDEKDFLLLMVFEKKIPVLITNPIYIEQKICPNYPIIE